MREARFVWLRQEAGFLGRREKLDSPACVFEAGAKAAAAALAEDDATIVNAAGADAEAEAIAEARVAARAAVDVDLGSSRTSHVLVPLGAVSVSFSVQATSVFRIDP